MIGYKLKIEQFKTNFCEFQGPHFSINYIQGHTLSAKDYYNINFNVHNHEWNVKH